MKTNSFIPTTLFAALLALPGMAFADHHMPAVNQGNITPADATSMPAPNTLQQEIEGPNGELLATQPGEVEMQEEDSLEDDGDEVDTMPDDSDEVDTMPNDSAEVEVDSEAESSVGMADAQPTQLNQQHSSPDYRPLIQGEVNNGKVTPADLRNQSAPITLKEKKKGPRGELLATQPGEVELQENRRISAP